MSPRTTSATVAGGVDGRTVERFGDGDELADPTTADQSRERQARELASSVEAKLSESLIEYRITIL